jgi:hypothetical protein
MITEVGKYYRVNAGTIYLAIQETMWKGVLDKGICIYAVSTLRALRGLYLPKNITPEMLDFFGLKSVEEVSGPELVQYLLEV